MMQQSIAGAGGAARLTRAVANILYLRLWAVLLALLAVVVVMWLVNVFSIKELNFIGFTLGGALVAFTGFMPTVVVLSMLAGMGAGGLGDKDLSQGALTGIKTLYEVVVSVLFIFFFLAGILSTWSFEESPLAFPAIAAMLTLVSVAGKHYGIVNKKVPMMVIIVYAVGIITYAAFTTIPDEVVEGAKSLLPTMESLEDEGNIEKQVEQKDAVWRQPSENGIPVGVWSKEIEVPLGCYVKFAGGNCSFYEVRYRHYRDEWNLFPCNGTEPPASHLQFRALAEGMTKVPYQVRCD